ncbi:DUF6625 family protein [Alistipes sp.]|uniref:DUF6625 family protein n=1 Tax=Alistipes sp. TaxID=1872444 RepID=UPI003AF107AC
MEHRIVFLLPYFGKWPEWIDLFFHSCSHTRFIDFYLFTDCPLPHKQYDNIFFHTISFPDYCQLVSQRLGIRFEHEKPYKLCDLKPFYGIIHEDIAARYDYWAFGDCDLVFGDMSPVKRLLDKRYALITTHSFRIAGHFTCIKRDSRYHKLCFNIRDWRKKLEHTRNYSLDELDWSERIYPELKAIKLFHKVVRRVYRKGYLHFLNRINPLFCNSLTRRHFFEYDTTPEPTDYTRQWRYDPALGKVYDPAGKSLIYLHFLFFKKTPYLATENYWRPGFYQIPSGTDFDALRGWAVVFDNQTVKLEKK